MRANRKSSVLLWLITLALPCFGFSQAQAGDRKFEAQLIWATNEKQSPDAKHKVVDPEIRARLSKLPLKWENYFEVNRQQLFVDKGGTNKVCMSAKCTVEVNMKDSKKVEVLLIGKDGQEKLRQGSLLTARELFSLIDSMPMRRSEMDRER